MLLTTTAKKKLLLGNRIYSRGIAGFADQQIAFTRAQGGSCKVESLINLWGYTEILPLIRLPYFLMQQVIQQQKRNASAKL